MQAHMHIKKAINQAEIRQLEAPPPDPSGGFVSQAFLERIPRAFTS